MQSVKKSRRGSVTQAPATVTFVIDRKEVIAEKNGICKLSRYFEQLIAQFSPDQVLSFPLTCTIGDPHHHAQVGH